VPVGTTSSDYLDYGVSTAWHKILSRATAERLRSDGALIVGGVAIGAGRDLELVAVEATTQRLRSESGSR